MSVSYLADRVELTVLTTVAVEDAADELPRQIILEQNHPNPLSAQTTIRYELPDASAVRLAVYDALGREVAILAEQPQPAGWHEVQFDAGNLPSGVYLYQLQAGNERLTRRLAILR